MEAIVKGEVGNPLVKEEQMDRRSDQIMAGSRYCTELSPGKNYLLIPCVLDRFLGLRCRGKPEMLSMMGKKK